MVVFFIYTCTINPIIPLIKHVLPQTNPVLPFNPILYPMSPY